jgi:NAD(P)-dependent dehydrogenase (short-subunit alcohol dehydrogenase family)
VAKRYDVHGKTVLITGAARGIGAATAERLHGRGANVILAGLEPDRLAELAAKLGDRAVWHEADATNLEALEDAVAVGVERFGGIDVAIANAGVHWTGAFTSTPLEQLERELEINLNGVIRTAKAVLPQITQRRGYLLNIASLAAAVHAPTLSTYNASKAGVEALTNSLRVELAPTGTRVGCAYFGIIETDMVRDAFAHPAVTSALEALPGFAARPAPLSAAVDAIEAGVLRRRSRVWAPRYVGAALAARGLFQPLTELRAMRARQIARSVELAEPEAGLDLSGARNAAEKSRV